MNREEIFDKIAVAYVRRPVKNMGEGVSPAVGIPDVERALLQHEQYCEALRRCGVDVVTVPSDPEFPDGSFMGDMAVVADNVAVLGNFTDDNPRQGEQRSAAEMLAGGKFMRFVTAPGRLDAGDVLQINDRFYIGVSDHTNTEGAAQLAFFLKEYGHEATVIDMDGDVSFRLKSAVTYLGRDRVLIREELERHYAFLEYEKIVVPSSEKKAANALVVNGTVLLPAGCPLTARKLADLDIPVIEVNVSEFEKMNGGLSCLSLRVPKTAQGNVVQLPTRGKKTA